MKTKKSNNGWFNLALLALLFFVIGGNPKEDEEKEDYDEM